MYVRQIKIRLPDRSIEAHPLSRRKQQAMVHKIVLIAVLFLLLHSDAFLINKSFMVAPNIGSSWQCMVKNCSEPVELCAKDYMCIKASLCNTKCQLEKDVNGCNLVCELTYGKNSTAYRDVVQCMATHGCLPKMPPDGECLTKDTDTIQNLTKLAQVQGKWWILKGLNCGQKGWPAGFDFFPCQRDKFVFEGSQWIDHISYCGGKNNTCTTPMINTTANVSITAPGVMTHWYLDAPLLPQIEYWRVLSWPHPEWMLYIYCGSTPIGPYAGGSVVSNSSRSISDIPSYVEKIFYFSSTKV